MMMLDINSNDRKRLYEMQRRITYMQASANMMSDQYSIDTEECEALALIGLGLSPVLVALDEVLNPD